MPLVNVMVNSRAYTIACDDGEEDHLRELAATVDAKTREVLSSVGQVGDTRLLLMAALLIVVHKLDGNPQHIVMWVGLNLVLTFTSPGISWQGHIGGFLTGGIVAAIIAYAPKEWGGFQGRARIQTAGAVLVALALVALALARLATWS